jgi:cysteinyl-tRNA synthetase
MLRIHDTLTRTLREVTAGPDGILRFYSCGPTIHDLAHVGNYRTYVWVDVFKRVLRARGTSLRHVMNITDVEDKIIDKARAAGIDVTVPSRLPELTAPYEQAFHEDLATLRILPADQYPHATQMVPEMIELVGRLIERSHAYVADGSVYFRIESMPSYGRLAHLDAAEIRAGARVDHDEYAKADARDFVLWKAWRPGEPRWDSPWGPGRPGWHLECSVMAMKCLGSSTLDVHAGGEDLIFPHHENEIAQSEGATGQPFCRLWMHGAHLRVDGQKMSKSLHNFYTLRDLLGQGHSAQAVRYLLASVHYRAPLNLTREALEAAARAIDRLAETARLLLTASPREDADDPALVARLEQAGRDFDAALDDDLNTSAALGVLFSAVRDVNSALAAASMGRAGLATARDLLARADAVFAVLPPGGFAVQSVRRDVAGSPYEVAAIGEVPVEVLERVVARQAARRARDFAAADRVRAELAAAGWVIEDVPGGARVKRA